MAKEKTKRVQFSFDDRDLESLKFIDGVPNRSYQPYMERRTCFPAPTPSSYKEVTITSPETNESRVIIVPVYE